MDTQLLKKPTTARLLIAMVLGILTGLIFGDACQALSPISNAFIMLLKMTVLPYMVCSLVHGTGSSSPDGARKLLASSITVILLTWALLLSVIEGLAVSFPESPITPMGSQVDTTKAIQHILKMLIPENVFAALANNVIPGIVLFSLLFGAALLRTTSKKPLLDFFNVALEVLTRMTQWIGQLAPIGVFALLAVAAGTLTWDQLCTLELYVFTTVSGALILIFWTIPQLFSALTPIPASRLFKELRGPLLLAFTTNSTLIAVPYLVDGLKRLLLPHPTSKENVSVETLVPLVYNVPFGNLFMILAILFMAFFFNHPLTGVEHTKLLLLGVLSVFGSPINSISFLVDQMQLPPQAIDLYLATHAILGNFLAALGALCIASVCVLILMSAEKRLQPRPFYIVRSLIVTAFLVFLVILALQYSGVVKFAHPCSS